MKNLINSILIAGIVTLNAFAGGYRCGHGDTIQDEIIPEMENMGFNVFDVKESSPREEGETYSINLTTRNGKTYYIVGLGDQYVDDIDVKVYAPCGTLVDFDTDTNKSPEALFEAHGGVYKIVFNMVGADHSGRIKVALGSQNTYCDNYTSHY